MYIKNALNWKKGCFHIHTPASDDYGLEKIKAPEGESVADNEARIIKRQYNYKENRKITPLEYLQKFIRDGFNFIVINDHQSIDSIKIYREALNQLKTGNDLDFEIFPGIEINIDKYHVNLIFDPSLSDTSLLKIFSQLHFDLISGKSGQIFPWDDETKKLELSKYQSIDDLVISLKKIDLEDENGNIIKLNQENYLISYTHAKSKKGFFKENSPETRKKIYTHHKGIIELNKMQLCNKQDMYNDLSTNGELPVVICSDYHGYNDSDYLFPTWIKLEDYSIKSLRQCLYEPCGRISTDPPKLAVFPIIKSLTIGSDYYSQQKFDFSPHLNVIVGGRGTGKSTIFDLLWFIFRIHDRFFKNEILDKESQKILNKFIKKSLIKLNTLLQRSCKISVCIHNFSQTYPQIYLEREFRYQDEEELIESKDYLFMDMLSSILSVSDGSNLIDITLIGDEIEYFSNFYFQKQFEEMADLPEFPIYILENLAEQSERFAINKIKQKNEILINKIKKIEISLNKLYADKDFIDLSILSNAKEKLEQELRELNTKFDPLSTPEDKKLQEEHTQWESIDHTVQEIARIGEENSKKILNWIQFIKNNELTAFPNIESPLRNLDEELFNEMTHHSSEIYSSFENLSKGLLTTLNEWEIFDKKNLNHISEFQNKFNTAKSKHLTIYDQLLTKKKELSKIQTEINIKKKKHTETVEKILKVNKLIKDIIEFEEKYNTAIQEFDQNNLEIIQKREKFLKSTKTNHERTIQKHLDYVLKKKNDYFAQIKNNTDRIQESLINRICSNHSGSGFINLLKNEELHSISINPTSVTSEKLYHLYDVSSLNQDHGVKGLLSPILFEIQRARLIDQVSVKITKNDSQVDLLDTSPGEQQRNLLLMALIHNKYPIAIDQPEDNLDFEVKNLLPDYLKKAGKTRQLIIITHFPNIPVLGDADKIFFLTEKNSGKIDVKEGAFESMAPKILEMEGGLDAINKRKSRYDGLNFKK